MHKGTQFHNDHKVTTGLVNADGSTNNTHELSYIVTLNKIIHCYRSFVLRTNHSHHCKCWVNSNKFRSIKVTMVVFVKHYYGHLVFEKKTVAWFAGNPDALDHTRVYGMP
jgi:hypothetical protein